MIASSSTIRALLIATLAVVGSANNESSTLLRGNSVKQEQEAFDVDVDERRNLVEIDMTMGFGEMVCKEHISLDGSVVCTFRTTPPTDMVSNTIQKGCVYTTTSNSNFCLASQVNRVPYNYEVPDASQAIEVVIQTVKPVPPSQPVLPTQPVTPVIGACPSFQPNTGITCSMYIPIGNTETACVYGQLKCSCALQNSDRSIAVGWDCFIIPENGGVTPPVNPGNPDIGIDIDQQEQNIVVVSPTFAPVPVNVGQILPNIINPPNCPDSKPEDGIDCDWGQRCKYFTMDAVGVKTGFLNCDCNGDCVFQCRKDLNPIFSF